MLLPIARMKRLAPWRSSLACSVLSFAAFGLTAGGCGAPAPTEQPDTTATTDIDPTTGDPTTEPDPTATGDNGTTDIDGIPETSATSDEPEETTGPLGVDGEFCNDFELEFLPNTPTVFILVDQSSSMFETINVNGTQTNLWDPMKAGVLEVVEALQSDVRFGFATYTGTQTMCTGIQTSTAIAENNFDVIKAAYDGQKDIMVPNDFQTKGETPTPAALLEVTNLLLADPSPGERFIFLVSDGEPDFCEDNLGDCAVDATIAALQYAYSQGIKSFVFGIENDNIKNPAFFDYFAQGGAGEQPSWSEGLDVLEYSSPMQSKCDKRPEAQTWADLREINGHAPPAESCGTNQPPEGNTACYMPAATYSEAGGTAMAYMDPDPSAIATSILTEVEMLKSCVIDVNFAVADGAKDKGEIYVGDLTVPIAQEEWRLNTPSQIELLGASCDKWLLPDTSEFFAGFPCEVIEEKPIIR